MPISVRLLFFSLLLQTPLHAADLRASPPSRIGAVFEARVAPVILEEEPLTLPAFPSPQVPGYYGRAGDFAYRNYYGTSPFAIYGRLPYACGLHGYC